MTKRSDLMDALLDLVEAHTDPMDDAQELPLEIVDSLKSERLFSLLLPPGLGGSEVSYPDYVALVQRFARVDASTAWCINQGSVLATLARFLPDDASRQIWTSPDITLANGPPTPGVSKSIEVDGGYRVTGTWTFSSGIAHADWLIGVATASLQDGSKEPRWHFFPKAAATCDFKWDVSGLRRTGSYGFSVNDLFVPDDQSFGYVLRKEDPPMYQIPLNLLFAGGFAAVALGVSRAAIDAATRKVREKVKRFATATMHKDTATQDVLGRAEAIWRSADSYLNSVVAKIWTDTVDTGIASTDNRFALRLAATHVIRESKRATDLVYDLCSTDSIRQNEEVHRCFQDIHVISQHLQGRPEVYGIVGSYELGLSDSHFLVD